MNPIKTLFTFGTFKPTEEQLKQYELSMYYHNLFLDGKLSFDGSKTKYQEALKELYKN